MNLFGFFKRESKPRHKHTWELLSRQVYMRGDGALGIIVGCKTCDHVETYFSCE